MRLFNRKTQQKQTEVLGNSLIVRRCSEKRFISWLLLLCSTGRFHLFANSTIFREAVYFLLKIKQVLIVTLGGRPAFRWVLRLIGPCLTNRGGWVVSGAINGEGTIDESDERNEQPLPASTASPPPVNSLSRPLSPSHADASKLRLPFWYWGWDWDFRKTASRKTENEVNSYGTASRNLIIWWSRGT